MDEPLASLDLTRKREIMPYLQNLGKELSIPILYVSHSIDEIVRLADHLIILNNGRVDTNAPLIDTLSELGFSSQLGEDASTILDTRVTGHDELGNLAKLSFNGGELWLNEMALGFASLSESIESIGQTIRLRVMAKDVSITLSRHNDTSVLNILSGEIEEIAHDALKGLYLVKVRVGESIVIARVTQRSVHHLELDVGKPVWLQIKSVALVS